jgi:TPR repeat protein
MKTAWLMLGVLGWAIFAAAQTNAPVVPLKPDAAEPGTNQVNWGVRSEPRILRGQVQAVYSSRFRFAISDPYDEAVNGRNIIVQNYPGMERLVSGQPLAFAAQKIGTIRAALSDGTVAAGEVLELWEYYLYLPPQLTPEEMAAARTQKEIAAQKAAARAFLAQSNAVCWLQPQATNGSASAQCSLGLHYLNGEGCATNREQAIYWLQRASAQGSFEASNTLARLKP